MRPIKSPAYYDQLEQELDRRFYGADPGRIVLSVPQPEMPPQLPVKPISDFPRTRCGTTTGYAGGCRCNLCRQAHAAQSKAYRAASGQGVRLNAAAGKDNG